jgi:hypothetical protein
MKITLQSKKNNEKTRPIQYKKKKRSTLLLGRDIKFEET